MLAQKGSIELLPGEITRTWQETQRSKQIGDLGGDGYTGSTGVRNELHDVNGRQTDQNSVRTSLSSNKGDISLVAKEDLVARGADIAAGNDVTLVGRNVVLDAATDTLTQAERHRVNQAGGTIALSGYGVQAAQAAEAAQRASETGDDRMAALYGAQAGYAAKDAMQGTGAAVKVTVSVGSSSASSSSTLQRSTEQGSTVSAGRNVTVVATGDGTSGADGYAANGDITLRGAQISAGNNASFDAARDINFLSSQSSHQQDGSNKSGSGSVGVGFGLGGSQNGFTIEVAASAAQGQMQGNGTTHQATQVEAGNQLSLTSGRDTTLQGAQAMGDSVLADIGRDLTLSSSQDRQYYDQKDQNGGFGVSLCIPPLCFGASSGSVSYGQTDIHNNYNSTTQQTGIAAGAGGYQINVGNHTQLDGAVIASTADPSKNLLSTESLGVTDLSNHANYSGGSFGGSVGFSGSIGDQSNGGVNAGAPTESRWNNPGASPSLGIPQGDSASSVTRSDIAAGTAVVRNGDTSALEGLERTATDLQQEGLANKFEAEQVQRDLVAGQIAGEVVFRATGDITKALTDTYRQAQMKADIAQTQLDLLGDGATPEQRGQLKQDIADANAVMAANQVQYDLWKEGGAGKALLHAASGAIVAGSGGADALSGALGAGASELGRPLTAAEGSLIQQLVSAAMGAVGGDVGLATGLAGEQYNRQLHPDEIKFIDANALAFAQREFACAEQCTPEQVKVARQRLMIQAVRQVDEAWNKMLGHKGLTAQDGNAQKFLSDATSTTTGEFTYFAADYAQYTDSTLFADKLRGTQELSQLYGVIISSGKTEDERRNLLQALNRVDAGWRDDFVNGVVSRDAWTILTTFTGDVGFALEVSRKVATGDVEGAVKDVATAFAMAKLAGQLGKLVPVKGPTAAPSRPVAEAIPDTPTPGSTLGERAATRADDIVADVGRSDAIRTDFAAPDLPPGYRSGQSAGAAFNETEGLPDGYRRVIDPQGEVVVQGPTGKIYETEARAWASVNVRLNQTAGAEFERQVIEALSHNGVTKNTVPVEVALPNGQKVTTIPDSWGREAGGLLEIKNVKNLRMTSQLDAQLIEATKRGEPLNLIISPRTESVAKTLQRRIERTGGKVYRYDPKTGVLTEY